MRFEQLSKMPRFQPKFDYQLKGHPYGPYEARSPMIPTKTNRLSAKKKPISLSSPVRSPPPKKKKTLLDYPPRGDQ